MLLVMALVGTTVAPWLLSFQQAYVIDKRITPRLLRYERVDQWLGIAIAVVGAAAMIGLSAAAFGGRAVPFTSAASVVAALGRHAGRIVGDLFALALFDASFIGACAVSLSTAYATADVLGVNHSLHRPVTKAKGFYVCYAGLMAAAAVLVPGASLGLLAEGVQTLAGVLLPSATLFLLLLCNDKAVLGPWVSWTRLNVFSAAVVWVLVPCRSSSRRASCSLGSGAGRSWRSSSSVPGWGPGSGQPWPSRPDGRRWAWPMSWPTCRPSGGPPGGCRRSASSSGPCSPGSGRQASGRHGSICWSRSPSSS